MHKSAAGIVAAFIVIASTMSAASAVGASPGTVQRYSGADRYDAAVSISHQYGVGVPVVYIAKGTDYPDALSAGPAATAQGGPLLLTEPGALPESIRLELIRLQPRKIVVVGGEASVEPAVFTQLQAMQPNIIRLGGENRYAAARAVVDYAFGVTGATRVYLATGTKFPDALSASAAAGARAGAVLLVDGASDTLDPATRTLIQKLHPKDVAIAGGPASVTPALEKSLSSLNLAGSEVRLSGEDRYDASLNISQDTFSTASKVYLSTGLNFPDALAGAALAGREDAPLFLVPGTCVTPNVIAEIRLLNPAQLIILGGTGSVSSAVENLTPCPVPLPPFTQPFSFYVPVVSSFGQRVHPITQVVTMHNGSDYSKSGIKGTPIRAIASGTVAAKTTSYATTGMGNSITVAHSAGVKSLSMHMIDPSLLAVGARVEAGQVIGYVGQTGAATGPHLHLEIRINGSLVDPYQFLQGAPLAAG